MKKKLSPLMTFLNRTLPNICIILACMILTFLIINEFNSAMQFLTNDITITLMYILMAVAIWVSISAIWYERKLYKARRIMHRMQDYINEHMTDENGDPLDKDGV